MTRVSNLSCPPITAKDLRVPSGNGLLDSPTPLLLTPGGRVDVRKGHLRAQQLPLSRLTSYVTSYSPHRGRSVCPWPG